MFIFILFIAILIAFLYFGGILDIPYTKAAKGAIGESKVAKTLHNLDREKYRVINNIYVAVNGGITQIDHIVVSIYGIFIIETKNYKGWIHGGENSEQWTLTLYNEKIKFRNPIKQNHGHVFMIEKVLNNFRKIKFHSIIVFVGEAQLKNIKTTTPVIYIHQLLSTIEKKRTQNLTFGQLLRIEKQINEYKINNRNRKREHIRNVKRHVEERNRKLEILVCPNCGGDLLKRNGPHGKFYGCSNYPKCRFSKGIS